MIPGKDASTLKSFVESLEMLERQALALYYADRLTCREIAMVLERTEQDITSILEDVRRRATTELKAHGLLAWWKPASRSWKSCWKRPRERTSAKRLRSPEDRRRTIPGLYVPLSTLRPCPCGQRRMTRGRYGPVG